MCAPAFTMWLFVREDQHPGALRALALGVPVDPEPDPEETPAERESRLLKELGYDSNTPLTEKGWKPT